MSSFLPPFFSALLPRLLALDRDRTATAAPRFALPLFFLVLDRHGDRRCHDRIDPAARDNRHAGREFHGGDVHRMTDLQRGEVHLDESRQVLRQAGNVQIRRHVADDRARKLHGGRLLAVHEVQRNLHVDLAILVDALEIHVQDLVAERVHLHVAQQHFGGLAVELHRQDRRMKRFVAQRVEERVVVELDRRGLGNAPVDDTRRLARAAHAAGRAATFGVAGKCGEFDVH